MKRVTALTIAVFGSIAAISPASAQAWRLNTNASQEIRQDVNQLERQIDRAEERRTISRREASALDRRASQVRTQYRRYLVNGLSRAEVASLEQQINEIRAQLKLARRNWDGRR